MMLFVLFRGESSSKLSKGNSKDLGRGDPFNAGKQRRKGSIRKAWTMKDYFLGFEGVQFKFVGTGPLKNVGEFHFYCGRRTVRNQ